MEGPLDFSSIVKDVKANLSKYSSTKLAEMIITHRYFQASEEIAILAMEELARRRADGDSFAYENYIEENLATLPKLDFPMVDLGSILGGLGIKNRRSK